MGIISSTAPILIALRIPPVVLVPVPEDHLGPLAMMAIPAPSLMSAMERALVTGHSAMQIPMVSVTLSTSAPGETTYWIAMSMEFPIFAIVILWMEPYFRVPLKFVEMGSTTIAILLPIAVIPIVQPIPPVPEEPPAAVLLPARHATTAIPAPSMMSAMEWAAAPANSSMWTAMDSLQRVGIATTIMERCTLEL
jgi:hypothetical protein